MVAAVRSQAPIASFSGNSIPSALPADGSTVAVQYAGDLYHLTMNNGEVVVSGGEAGRVTPILTLQVIYKYLVVVHLPVTVLLWLAMISSVTIAIWR